MSWNLPKLPGYTFENPEKNQFHRPSKLKYHNGYAIVEPKYIGIGRDEVDSQGTQYLEVDSEKIFDPQLTYGRRCDANLPIPQPHFVKFDKKMLIFKAFIKENDQVFDTSAITRFVNIIYYLEDDTLSISEPHIQNSGLYQGKVVKRGKIVKDKENRFWNWKDFNVGIDIKIHGLTFYIISCDDFTKEFLTSQGIELGGFEEISEFYDPNPTRNISSSKQSVHSFDSDQSNECRRNLERYLIYDNKALKFDAIWDDSASEHGGIRYYKLFYYLYDNTVSIKECYEKNDGRDPFSMLLRRTKLPKDWKSHRVYSPVVVHEVDSFNKNDDEYYNASDLLVGNTINVLGRPFLLLDCDSHTRQYYKEKYNITQPERIELPAPQTAKKQIIIPPHIGIGDPDDTLMSCFSFFAKPPFKDVLQYNINTNNHLRYLCEMISVHPEDKNRRFVLLYNLADSTIRIDELAAKNSGIIGGRFFGPCKVKLPGGGCRDFYTPDMFYIGAIIIVHQHKFSIIGADLHVYNYMKQHPDKFPSEVVQNIHDYHVRIGNFKEESALAEYNQNLNENQHIDEIHAPETIDTTDFNRDSTMPELPPALQGMECAQNLPITVDKEERREEHKGQPFVCVTGMTQLENVPQDLNYEQSLDTGNVEEPTCECNPGKRVTFADVPYSD